jgi:hypothetical protein
VAFGEQRYVAAMVEAQGFVVRVMQNCLSLGINL